MSLLQPGEPPFAAEIDREILLQTASVITMGIFDGVHLGHQALIRRAVEVAKALRLPAIGLSFAPHPAKILAPDVAPKQLISVEERAERMLACGLDRVIIQPFTKTFSQIPAEDFEREVLAGRLGARHLVVGFNFQYGRGRGGDGARLKAVGPHWGFDADVVQAVTGSAAQVVSSSRIRAAVAEADFQLASTLLGRPYQLSGAVVPGEQRGRQLGFPTANLRPEAEQLPAGGVYAARVFIQGEDRPRLGVTNIGVRPSFDGEGLSVETFIPGFSGDLYGQRLRLQPIARLRGERRFDGAKALVQQIEADLAQARALWEQDD